MSNNRIKSCECFRFPSGTAICTSEHIKQKADIQIYKNNVLLNCNNKLLESDLTRRVYSGTQNRLRSINGYKLSCNSNPDCIFIDKKSADYWIIENSIDTVIENGIENGIDNGIDNDNDDGIVDNDDGIVDNDDGIVDNDDGIVDNDTGIVDNDNNIDNGIGIGIGIGIGEL